VNYISERRKRTMRSVRIAILVFLLVSTSCINKSSSSIKDDPSLVKDVLGVFGATTMVYHEAGRGTTFHIGGGYFITAAHVVNGFDQVYILGKQAEMLDCDHELDIALLRVESLSYMMHFKVSSEIPQYFEEVGTIGYHFGMALEVTLGKVSNRHIGSPYFDTTVPMNGGCSGGPVFNHRFEVIGINISILSRYGGWNGVSKHLKGHEIIKFIENYERTKSRTR